MRVWDSHNGSKVMEIDAHNEQGIVDIQGLEDYNYSIGYDGLLKVWDIFDAENPAVFSIDISSITSPPSCLAVAFTDTSIAAVGHEEGTVSLWNIESRSFIFSI